MSNHKSMLHYKKLDLTIFSRRYLSYLRLSRVCLHELIIINVYNNDRLFCSDVPVSAALSGGPLDVNSALQEVLKTALIHDGLVHGLHQAAKVLDK